VSQPKLYKVTYEGCVYVLAKSWDDAEDFACEAIASEIADNGVATFEEIDVFPVISQHVPTPAWRDSIPRKSDSCNLTDADAKLTVKDWLRRMETPKP
jgi:hypothetical protein